MTAADVIQPSASVASPSPTSLRYIGNHVYALGGEFGRATAEQTVLDVRSGSGYIVGRITVSAGIAGGNASGGVTTFQIKFNGQTVLWLKVESAQEDMASNTFADLILPPFTQMTIITDSDSTDATFQTTTVFTGRVYGAE